MTLRAAVIGCGAMGRNHLKAWAARPGAEVASVFDVSGEARNAAADEFGATAYDDPRAAIDHEGVDAVSVCTPTPFHREMACYAAQRGRHVACEKPLAGSAADAEAIVEAAERAGVWLTVGHQRRYWPQNQRIRALFQDGSLGAPLLVRYEATAEVRPKIAMHRRSMNQGPVMDMAVHWFDLMRFFTGAEVERVAGMGHVFGRGKARLAEIPDDDLAIDAAEVQARFTGGHVLSFGINWGMPEGFPGGGGERMAGPSGVVRHGAEGLEAVFGAEAREALPGGGGGPELVVGALADAIERGTPPAVSGADGCAAVRGAQAALEAIERGSIVELE